MEESGKKNSLKNKNDVKEISFIFSGLENPLRIEILFTVRENSMTISTLAKNMKTRIQNLQRHIQKLLSCGLLVKTFENKLIITPLGEYFLSTRTSLDFITKNKKYFDSHSFEGIPEDFLLRLGELNNSQFVSPAMHALEIAKNAIESAQEFQYGTTTQISSEHYQFCSKPIQRGVKNKIIFGKNTIFSDDYFDSKKRKQWEKGIKEGQIQERYVQFLPLTIGITDKMAVIDFANKREGKRDFFGLFYSEDDQFRKWCLDLFNYYWNMKE